MVISFNSAHRQIRWLRLVLLIVWVPIIAMSPCVTGSAESVQPGILPAVIIAEDIEQYAIKRVQPDYPMLAQKHKIEGVVIMDLKVNTDGKVTDAQFVNGHNVFRSVSIDAARQWEFRKGKGESGIIRFTFKLR